MDVLNHSLAMTLTPRLDPKMVSLSSVKNTQFYNDKINPSLEMASFLGYSQKLCQILTEFSWDTVAILSEDLFDCWRDGRQVFLVGNGGSAGNAVHLANDFLYALSKRPGSGLRAHALSANPAVLTALANDEGYDRVFELQLLVQARPGDLLIAFSGSGNSPNILRGLDAAKSIGMRSFAVLGFDGGKAKAMADVAIHVPVADMQIAEDFQLIIGHMIMQRLYSRRDEIVPGPST
jgi:D-sedoheptulose 7-phosphate isomerase